MNVHVKELPGSATADCLNTPGDVGIWNAGLWLYQDLPEACLRLRCRGQAQQQKKGQSNQKAQEPAAGKALEFVSRPLLSVTSALE